MTTQNSEGTPSAFGDYASYYDMLYKDKPYREEAKFVQKLLEEHHQGVTDILELGCGTGRHATELARLGFNVTGVEQSTGMLTLANARRHAQPQDVHERIVLHHGDIRSVALGKRFDAVISLFHVMSYMSGEGDLGRAFKTAIRHLRPGGLFLFDCWYGPAVLAAPLEATQRTAQEGPLTLTRTATPHLDVERGVVTMEVSLKTEEKGAQPRTITESHPMRYLFTPEIADLMRCVGLNLAACGEWMTGASTSRSSFSVYYIGVCEG